MSATGVQQGQVVHFTYNKGSKPGTPRLVLVTDVTPTHIKGRDLDAPETDNFRNYARPEVGRDLRVVAKENEEIVRASELLVNPGNYDANTLTQIYKLMQPDREVNSYDAAAKVLVVKRNNLPRIEFGINGTSTTIDFINADGKRIGFSFTYPSLGNTLPLPHVIACPLEAKTFAEFADRLVKNANTVPAVPTGVNGWSQFVQSQAAKGNPLYAGVSS